MTSCHFQRINGCWTCGQCGWRFTKKGVPVQSDKPPCRNCTKSPALDSPEHRERIKEQVLAELEPMALTSDHEAIATQLDQCLESCKRFNGRTCTARGGGCRLIRRWLEFLALLTEPCRRFEPSE